MGQKIFPERPTVEELQEQRPAGAERAEQYVSDGADVEDLPDDLRDWYEDAIYVAARVIVECALEDEDFREAFLDDQGIGSAYLLAEFDDDRWQVLRDLGISAYQGANAEELARNEIERQLEGGG